MKQDPVRTCVGCRVKRPKKELARFTVKDSKLVIDGNAEYSVRGWYLCLNGECAEKLVKRAKLKRTYNISKSDLNEFLREFGSEVLTGCQVI